MGIILSLEKTKKHKLMAYWQKGSLKHFAKAHFIPTLILHTFFFFFSSVQHRNAWLSRDTYLHSAWAGGGIKTSKKQTKGRGETCNGWCNDLTTCCTSLSTQKIEQPRLASLNSSDAIIVCGFICICLHSVSHTCTFLCHMQGHWLGVEAPGDLGQIPFLP